MTLFEGTKLNFDLNHLIELSQHRSGYTRELAVKRLENLNDPKAIPALIERMNDWVLQVRQAAKKAFLNLLVPECTAELVSALPQIYHLKSCKRLKSTPIIKAVETFFSKKADRKLLESGILHKRCNIAILCTKIIITYKIFPASQIVHLCQQSKHNIVRLKAAELLQRISSPLNVRLISAALNDKFTPVRKKAIQLILDKGDTEYAVSVAKNSLTDHSSTVRMLAVNYLKKTSFNVEGYYLSSIDNATVPKLKCALWAIGFLSLKSYNNKIALYLDSEFPSIRKQPLRSLYQLDEENIKQILIERLKDNSLGVRQAAVRLLAQISYLLDYKDFQGGFKQVSNKGSYSSLLRVGRNMNKWDRITLLLALASNIKQSQKTESTYLEKEISIWYKNFNRSGVQPTSQQLASIKDNLVEAKVYLFHHEINSIYSVLIHTFKTYHIKHN
ncbi:HEAT repeat domain-containing protein [Aliikangiella coralliicola]|nr:HEAT repeat domain-containing protein [Aliikangiella coralliicola]